MKRTQPKMMPTTTTKTTSRPVAASAAALTPNRARMAAYWHVVPEDEPASMPPLTTREIPTHKTSIVVLGPRPPRMTKRGSVTCVPLLSSGTTTKTAKCGRPRSHSLAGIWPAHSNCQRSSLSPTIPQDEDCTRYKIKDKRKFPITSKSSSTVPATSSTLPIPSTCTTTTSTLNRCPSSVSAQSKGIITRQSSHKSSISDQKISTLQKKKNKEQINSSTTDVVSKTPIVSILKDNNNQDHNDEDQRRDYEEAAEEEEESMVIATTIPGIKNGLVGSGIRSNSGRYCEGSSITTTATTKSKLPCRHHNKNHHHHHHHHSPPETQNQHKLPPNFIQHHHLNPNSKASQRICSTSSDDYGFLAHRARHHSSSSYQPSSLQIFPSLSGGGGGHPARDSSVNNGSSTQAKSLAADVEGSGFVRGGYRRSSTKYNDHHNHRISRSDAEDDDDQDDPVADDHPNFVRRNDGGAETSITASKRSSKLKRRKAYYKEKKEGRSRSLTQIDSLDPTILTGGKLDMESKSGPISCSSEQVLLLTPPPDSRVSPKTNLVSQPRGKNRFFSSSTEEPAISNAGMMYEGGDSLSAPSTNLHSTQGSSDPNLNVSSSASNTAAKKRSLLSLSSPRHQQQQPRQSRATSGFISHEGSLKLKNTKHNRWSSLFSPTVKDNSKMDLLSHYLEQYEQYGIPRPSILPCDNDDMESINTIEEDWRLIISNWNDLSYRSKQQQSAIWELVESEAVYIRTLELLIDLFLACLYNLQAANILNDIDRDRIFSNICDVYKSNKVLWLDCMLPMVQKARDSKQPFQPSELHSGFTHFSISCLPYIQYCLDQSSAQDYCRRMDQMNPLFKGYLAWCETRKECNRERLTDILVRPLQRLTKYSLLLKAILKYTDDQEDRQCLEEMILSVERFVKSVNGALRSQQESERLHGIMDRIENYEVVETRDDELESVIKSHSKLNLFAPMPGCGNAKRWLIFDSGLRLRDSFSSKIDVHCFLFTDMLLICKSTTRKGEKLKVIRQPYVVDRILTREFVKDACAFGLVYLNEFGTADAALSLHGHESKLVKLWLENIRNARRLYLTAKAKANANFDIQLTEVEVDDYSATEPTLEIEEDENSGMIYLHSQSPREVSSRVSQLSSLLHSHSGSIEMNDSSRAVSFEQELRGSSLSSDDGNSNEQGAAAGGNASSSVARSLSVETGNLRPSSPRQDRRSFLSTSPTPNTLSVQIPCGYSGQSLPNLTSAYETSTSHTHSLTVPKSLSPTSRGVSYPPPSPRSLRRTKALLQSAKPPLQKSKNVANNECKSPEKVASLAASVSVDYSSSGESPASITAIKKVDIPPPVKEKTSVGCTIDITPPSKDVSPVAPHPRSSFLPSPVSPVSPTAVCAKEYPSPVDPQDADQLSSSPTSGAPYVPKRQSSLNRSRGSSPDRGVEVCSPTHDSPAHVVTAASGGPPAGIARRLARSDRLDTKRYYTAGVIEDIKKENSADKDASIHKRHSWNYGPQSQQNPGGHGHQTHHQLAADSAVLKNRHFFSCESMTSIRSSSGVSSTSSILHCISDLEAQDIPEEHSSIATSSNPSRPESPRHLHPDVLIAVSEPDRDEDEEDENSDVEDCRSVYSGGRVGGNNEQSLQGRSISPERVIWGRRLSGTDNPAFSDDTEFSSRPKTSPTSPIGEPQPRSSHFQQRKHFLMRDQVVGGQQHSSSSDSGSTDDPTTSGVGGHDQQAFANRQGGGGGRSTQDQRTKTSNILDFILTDASIEASEV